MKKLLLAVLALSSTTLFAQKKADDIAKLNTETFDFGKIKQNVPATATFVVTNITYSCSIVAVVRYLKYHPIHKVIANTPKHDC